MKSIRRETSEKFTDTEADEGKKGRGSFSQELARTLKFSPPSGLLSGFLDLYFFLTEIGILILCNRKRK